MTKAAALATALLPAAGYVVRLVGLIPGPGKEAAWSLAWKTSLADLVVTGLYGALPLGIAILLVAPIASSPRPRSNWRRWLARGWSIGLALVLVIFVPWFPLPLLALAGGLLTAVLFQPVIRQSGRIVFGEVWPRVAIVMAYGAIMTGLTGLFPGATPDEYHFSPAVASMIPNGQYVQVGEAGASLYLEDCAAHSIFAVDGTAVEFRHVHGSTTTTSPSLFEAVARGRRLTIGFMPSC